MDKFRRMRNPDGDTRLHPRRRVLTVLALATVITGWSQNSGDELVRRAQRVGMEQVEVVSPDGHIRFTILPNAERLTYQVSMRGKTVIEPSPMKMIVDGIDLSTGVGLRGVEHYRVDETYPWYGVHDTAINRGNGLTIALEHDLSFSRYTVELRAYDDGVAFRHVLPGGNDESRVPEELTAFLLPSGATAWYHDLAGHYEAPYQKKEVSEIEAGEWAGPPVTFKLPGDAGYGAITEANLVNYSGMALEADGRRAWITGLAHRQPLNYPFALRYGREEGRHLSRPASVQGTITTPWRVVLTARDLNQLVNSDLVHNLCPPPDPQYFPEGIKTDWIRPGRAVWRYLDGGENTLEEMKEFSRLAGRLGFEHHVIEGFWRRWSMEERRELVEYSGRQGVGVWFWRHTRELRTPEAREEFFGMCADLGVGGAKLDFLDHEAKEVIDLYEELLRVSAKHQILINFHGANKPTGRNRTWPHELVREAVRGMESSSLMERARHETILPFTRYLAGPADYTAMHFGERRRDTTWAHQIASAAIFDSPLLTLVAHPRTMLEHPAAEMIKSIPAVWDETIVLPDSEIGEAAVFARRKGEMWMLAIMNGPADRTLRLPLSFLSQSRYKILVVQDDDADAAAVEVQSSTMGADEILEIKLPAGGGFIARFQP